MPKIFKKNQRVLATLPGGRVVEGVYIEPYGTDGHSFYVNEFDSIGRNGEPVYTKKRYGVQDDFIEAITDATRLPSESQYKAWLKRATDLELKIKELNEDKSEKSSKKIERYSEKLAQINKKIEDYENGEGE